MQFARLTTKTSNVTDHVSFQSSDTANAATPSSDQATQFVLDDARMMMIDGDSHGAVKNFEPQHILNTHASYYSRASV